MNSFSTTAATVLEQLRERHPLVLCLTNQVVQNFTANLLLAIGAAPVMLQDSRECEQIIPICTNAVLINTGTLTQAQAETMLAAAAAAKAAGVPTVLDPVAVGLLSFRTEFCHKLLAEFPPTMIRGNASEIMALAGENAQGRGVDSLNTSNQAIHAAQRLARQTGAAVLVTGATDYATDGVRTFAITHGDPIMERVVGMGCSMGALAGACLASAPSPLEAAAACAVIMGMAGEIAAAKHTHPGSFAPAFLDELDKLSPADIAANARISEI